MLRGFAKAAVAAGLGEFEHGPGYTRSAVREAGEIALFGRGGFDGAPRPTGVTRLRASLQVPGATQGEIEQTLALELFVHEQQAGNGAGNAADDIDALGADIELSQSIEHLKTTLDKRGIAEALADANQSISYASVAAVKAQAHRFMDTIQLRNRVRRRTFGGAAKCLFVIQSS